MVNTSSVRLLVSGACKLANTSDGRVRIKNGPVYCLQTAQAHLKEHGHFVINALAQKHQKGKFSPDLSDEELQNFILTLVDEDWIESERCATSVGRTLDCDGYAMKWNRMKRCRSDYLAKIYVKFGFVENNPKVLIISIHPSKY